MDRLIFVGLYRLVPNTIKALTIVKPEIATPLRPTKRAVEIRRLIREISIANPLWGAPRIQESFSSSASMSARPAAPH
jgi:hypothetical protein